MYARTLLSGEYELGCPLARGKVCKFHVNKDDETSSSRCSPPDIQLISLSDSYPGLKTEWAEILKLVTSFLSVGLQELRRFCPERWICWICHRLIWDCRRFHCRCGSCFRRKCLNHAQVISYKRLEVLFFGELPNQQTISMLHARLVIPGAINYQGSITFSVVNWGL